MESIILREHDRKDNKELSKEKIKIVYLNKRYVKKSYNKKCIICSKEFKTNLSRILVCCENCRIIDKRNKSRERAKKWFKQNKERQYENVKKNYLENKLAWDERRFTNQHREEILNIIGNKCRICDKKTIQIHHLRYNNLPRNNLIEYCKYLLPLCKHCHSQIGVIVAKKFEKQTFK